VFLPECAQASTPYSTMGLKGRKKITFDAFFSSNVYTEKEMDVHVVFQYAAL